MSTNALQAPNSWRTRYETVAVLLHEARGDLRIDERHLSLLPDLFHGDDRDVGLWRDLDDRCATELAAARLIAHRLRQRFNAAERDNRHERREYYSRRWRDCCQDAARASELQREQQAPTRICYGLLGWPTADQQGACWQADPRDAAACADLPCLADGPLAHDQVVATVKRQLNVIERYANPSTLADLALRAGLVAGEVSILALQDDRDGSPHVVGTDQSGDREEPEPALIGRWHRLWRQAPERQRQIFWTYSLPLMQHRVSGQPAPSQRSCAEKMGVGVTAVSSLHLSAMQRVKEALMNCAGDERLAMVTALLHLSPPSTEATP